MELAEIKARIAAGRQFTHTVDGRAFHLLRPTPQQLRQAFVDSKDDVRLVARWVLDRCLVGWEGVIASDLDPGAGDDPVPFSDDARALWLDEHAGGQADELYLEVQRRAVERRDALERARGN